MVRHRWLAMVMVMALLAVAAAGVVGSASVAVAEPVESERGVKEAAALVRQLDAAEFKRREAATAGLRRMGWRADAALRAALAGEPSLEMEWRARRLLSVIEADEHAKMMARFRAGDDSVAPELPGWEQVRARFGTGRAARDLLADMLGTDYELIAVLDDPVRVGREWSNRVNAVWNSVRRGGQPEPGAVEALMFVATEPDTEVPDADDSKVTYILQRLAHSKKLKVKKGEPLHAMLVAYLSQVREPNTTYTRLRLTEKLEMPEVARAYVRALLQREGEFGSNAVVGWSLAYLATEGKRADLAIIEKFFNDDRVVHRRTVNKKRREIQARDVALAGAVQLTGQKLEDYGFSKSKTRSSSQLRWYVRMSHYVQESDATRQKAMKKWRAWREKNPDKPKKLSPKSEPTKPESGAAAEKPGE